MHASDTTQERPAGWVVRNRWKVALAVAAAASGYWWGRSRRPQIDVDRVSEQWLAEHAFDAGRHPPE
jgi:hypothetical protein